MSTLISLNDISMVRDRRTTLSHISLSVNRGDFIAITGPNGGGKTTLLRIILRLLKPTHGSVTYYDKKLKIGYLPQKNMIDSSFPITVSQVIASGLIGENLPSAEVAARLDDTLQRMGLTDHASKPIGNLSGGQLQRALLGRAIISRPDLLVLDEPLSYVDKRFEQYIYRLVESLAPTTTIILVSHEMSTISSMATRHLIIDRTLEECPSAHHAVHYDCEC